MQLQKETAYLPPSFSLLRESGAAEPRPLQVHISAQMMVMHSAHNERKRETIVKILREN